MRIAPGLAGLLHFVGIGGIGMSGIAEILHTLGYAIQGSDAADSANVRRLRDLGIRVTIGHDAANIQSPEGEDPAAVVISTAIRPGNPELDAARARRIPVVRRADMLAELMRQKWSIAVSGTHGKTTTTSMVGALLEAGGMDPTVVNGGIVNAYGTNVRIGAGGWLVAEADESDATITRLPSSIAVITNIDPEHLDHYGTLENIRGAFRAFVENLPFYGFAVLCADHPELRALRDSITDRRILTYGFADDADVRAVNVVSDAQGSRFDVLFNAYGADGEAERMSGVVLPMLGRHNVQNALAALTIGRQLDMSHDAMKQGLAGFSGVKRRFTCTGSWNDVTVIDDYGHHPVEIAAVLKAGRLAVEPTGGRIIAVVQPHRYSRLSSLFPEFCRCFTDADAVIVADVYAAGESPIPGADRDALVRGIRGQGHPQVRPLPSAEALPALIADIARPGDFVICLGAGNITQWANALPGDLTALPAHAPIAEAANG